MAKPVLGHDPFASLAVTAAAPSGEAKPRAAKTAKAKGPKAAPKPPEPAKVKAAAKKAAAPKARAPKPGAAKAPKPQAAVPESAAPSAQVAPLPQAPAASPAAAKIPDLSSLRAVCSKATAVPAQGLSSLLGRLWTLVLSPESTLPNTPAALFTLEDAAPALPLLAITARALAEHGGRRVFILLPKPESLAMALAAKWMDPPCLALDQARRALAQGDWVLANGAGEAAALGRPLATLRLSGQKPLCKSLPGPVLAGLEALAILPLWRPGKLLLHLEPAAATSSKAGCGA